MGLKEKNLLRIKSSKYKLKQLLYSKVMQEVAVEATNGASLFCVGETVAVAQEGAGTFFFDTKLHNFRADTSP
jgi:hypothetical protein